MDDIKDTAPEASDQQHTGNHPAPDAHGADKFGGTRTGAGNMERAPQRDERGWI